MNPSFKVRLLPKSKTRSKVMQKVNEQRDDELTCAVQWCRENNCRGWAAIKSCLFQLIKDPRTINKYLDGEIKIGHTKEYCSILNVEDIPRDLMNRFYPSVTGKKSTFLLDHQIQQVSLNCWTRLTTLFITSTEKEGTNYSPHA